MSKEYRDGVNYFVEFAFTSSGSDDKIRCPCLKCMNVERHVSVVIVFHLIQNGIAPSYKTWVHHGEPIPVNHQFVSNESCQPSGESAGDGVAADEHENPDDIERLVNDYYAAAIMNDEELDELPDNVETEIEVRFTRDDVDPEIIPSNVVLETQNRQLSSSFPDEDEDELLGEPSDNEFASESDSDIDPDIEP
ncbi:hypothetical protein MRB53_022029 [Persea americana]|uniref:Uncharacterized protein n=1 Tax=Persea americana TaxID=3435 RepID=A0ACC2L5D4_PERAE|nr:hypothetical protein MRB53_022029 [Persea americana]